MSQYLTSPVNIYIAGGFLGSGKTTAIIGARQLLMKLHKDVTVCTVIRKQRSAFNDASNDELIL